MVIAFLCAFAVIGVIQVLRPQLLWKMNRPLQRSFVKDYDATEPSAKGYLMMRVTGVVFLAAVGWMLAQRAA